MLGNIYMTPDEIVNQYGLKKTERKGDISFYEDETGNQYQQIEDGEIFKVRDGVMRYRTIKQIKGYIIKYNTNGVFGFCIYKGKICLEDRIWTLSEAERIVRECAGGEN